MTAGIRGADLEALAKLNKDLERHSRSLRTVMNAATNGVNGIEQLWSGPDSAQFKQEWLSTHRPRLLTAANELMAAAETVERNRRAQEDTSAAGDGGPPGVGAFPGGPELVPFVHQQGDGDDLLPAPEPIESPFVETMAARFEAIDPERREELSGINDELIAEYGTVRREWYWGAGPTGELTRLSRQRLELSHRDVGLLLRDLDGRSDLSDDEKAFIWNEFANGKEVPNVLGSNPRDLVPVGESGTELPYFISPDEAAEVVVNRDLNGADNTASHTVISFNDGYHAPLADLPTEEANQVILDKEGGVKSRALRLGIGTNSGDITASMRFVELLNTYQETGDFSDFSNNWIQLFVEPPSEPEMTVPAGTTTTTPTTTAPTEGPGGTVPQSPTTTVPPPYDNPNTPAGTTTTTTPSGEDDPNGNHSPNTTFPFP